MDKFLIIGQGSIGKPVAEHLAQLGYNVTGLACTPKHYQSSVRFYQADARTLSYDKLAIYTYIAIIITPSERNEQGYRDSYLAVCEHLAMLDLPITRIVFVSSTAVYGYNDGSIVDEQTPTLPATDTARVLLAAEEALCRSYGDRAVMIRASGIYGVDRRYMVQQAADAHHAGVPSHHYTNRIMDSDLVRVIVNVLIMLHPKPFYLATDLCPATSADVLGYIAYRMGYPPPQLMDAVPTGKRIIANIDPMWLSFTDYQSGYDDIMQKMV